MGLDWTRLDASALGANAQVAAEPEGTGAIALPRTELGRGTSDAGARIARQAFTPDKPSPKSRIGTSPGWHFMGILFFIEAKYLNICLR
jgi:hypothetical protein